MITDHINSIRKTSERLFPHLCGVVAPGNQALFRDICEIVPASILCFSSGAEFNGWVVPDEWHVVRALVRQGGRVVFDGTRHPLGVAAYSKSFSGCLSLEELAPHIHSRPDVPEAFGFHSLWPYRPWDADWCLCVPHAEFSKWLPGAYEVELVTCHAPGEMLVAVCDLPGESDETIVLNAHTCHPQQANDDIVGMAVAIELFRWLSTKKNRFSYRLVLCPEHLGTVFYLHSLSEEERKKMAGCYFLEMPGTPHPLKLASSFSGGTIFDRTIRYAAKHHSKEHVLVGWREGAGNDETVWEAPGYEIPCVEVSRCAGQFSPFREYHTSEDSIDRIHWDHVGEFYEVMQRTLETFEGNATLFRKFDGLVCLSNPNYNLYMERPDPAMQKGLNDNSEKWGHLLDSLFRCFDGQHTILDIAEANGLPFEELAEYLGRFADRGLLSINPVACRVATCRSTLNMTL